MRPVLASVWTTLQQLRSALGFSERAYPDGAADAIPFDECDLLGALSDDELARLAWRVRRLAVHGDRTAAATAQALEAALRRRLPPILRCALGATQYVAPQVKLTYFPDRGATERMRSTSDTPTEPISALPADVAGALARRFDSIVVFSGAGMSADSGIPTFRSGRDSLWSEFDPGDLATPDAWRRDKETVWAWYEWRRRLVMRAEPNPGHIAVARLQREFGAAVVTQNVDDLHERAGATSVLHLHGSLLAARCFACGEPHALGEPPQTPERQLRPPRCARCGGYVRPGVVWFGEDLPHDVLRQAKTPLKGCDLLLVIGTSGVVQPAAGLVNLAPKSATIVEINPDPSPGMGRHRWRLAATAAQGMPLIYGAVAQHAPSTGAPS